jgi:hypothetical protein
MAGRVKVGFGSIHQFVVAGVMGYFRDVLHPLNAIHGQPLFHPENGGCLHGVCSPYGLPEKHEHISGRILDGLNESNINEEVWHS